LKYRDFFLDVFTGSSDEPNRSKDFIQFLPSIDFCKSSFVIIFEQVHHVSF